MRITYRKKNGDIVSKVSYNSKYKIGEENSWGWVVINKEYYHKGKYISGSECDRLLSKSWRRDRIIRDLKINIKRVSKEFLYFAIILIFIKYVVLTFTINM